MKFGYSTVNELLKNKKIYEGSKSIVLGVLDTYNEDMGGIDVPTVTGALAALLGERVIRYCHPDVLESGPQYIRSEAAEDLMFRGKNYGLPITKVVSFIVDYQSIKNLPQGWADDIVLRTTRSFGGGGMFPSLSIESDYYPQEWSPNAQMRFREFVDFTAANHALGMLEQVYMLAVGLGNFLEMSDDFTPILNDKKILFQLAMEVCYGCACMAPIKKEII